jgi:hypothetical protein
MISCILQDAIIVVVYPTAGKNRTAPRQMFGVDLWLALDEGRRPNAGGKRQKVTPRL